MVSEQRKKELLFPYEIVREEQNKLLLLSDVSIENKKNLIVHAPTGLGKTVAALGPALAQAIKQDKTVLFLTSRHTQHEIAIETLKLIKEKYNTSTIGVSIIGKKWMCIQPGVSKMYSSDFAEYCEKLRADGKCNFYSNTRKSQTKLTTAAEDQLKTLHTIGPLTTEQVIEHGKFAKMCPYELSLATAKKAKVIITDYYYLFHPHINQTFLKRLDKELSDFIVIIDEAHNLPYRLKDLASEYLTTITLKRAIKEAAKYGYDNTVESLQEIVNLLEKLGKELQVGKEIKITRQMFEKYLNDAYDYEQLIGDFTHIAEAVREVQKQSYLGSIVNFLEKWQGQDEGFVRILAHKRGMRDSFFQLSYRCLDPSVVSKEIINNTHSTIMMSGTLLPTQMYKELLGVENVQEVVFKDPFPALNRLNLVIPKTTTKFTARSDAMYEQIAEILADVVNEIPGNSAVFFPSYHLRNRVSEYFDTKSKKTIFSESPNMSKSEKQELLDKFKSYSETGAVLLGAASGSYGEGIDLPGDFLKGVIVVGLPLSQPDLETKSLIEYFDKKFQRGWDYGYMFPAFNKTLQNAGRCIRSETDKGIIVFLDERYIWRTYARCFPEDWEMEVSMDNYKDMISEFF